MIYSFDDFVLDGHRCELRRGDAVVAVEPQVFDLLEYLIAHRDRVVDKRELLDEVWGTRFVTESALTSRIKAARRALGDDGQAQRMIRTTHGRGYRFVAAVSELDVSASPTTASGQRHTVARGGTTQAVRFCHAADGVRLACASVGDGTPLVKAANWLTHVRYSWESIVWQHWLRDLSSGHQLLHYDERGCGQSDWDVEDVSFPTWIRDLECVVDTAGLEQFALLGISQGGAVAAAYAALHPERVSHLVLYGAFPLGRRKRARTGAELRDAEMMLELLRTGWAREDSPFGRMLASQFMPHGTIRSPTLVLHAVDDHRVPCEQGELFAALIPGARFVPLESANHILLEEEPAWARFLSSVEAFLAER